MTASVEGFISSPIELLRQDIAAKMMPSMDANTTSRDLPSTCLFSPNCGHTRVAVPGA